LHFLCYHGGVEVFTKGFYAVKSAKTVFVCSECGAVSRKWAGKCPECERWNTMIEEEEVPSVSTKNGFASGKEVKAEKLSETALPSYIRNETGMGELDRVLGGGLVSGSVVLLSGEPGIGKSTLLLQISHELARGHKVLYVSGEESRGQLKLRAERLGVLAGELYILTETNLDAISRECMRLSPDVLIGGFHFSKMPLDGRLAEAARTLASHSTEYYTCHCTGEEQFAYMRQYMQNLRYLSCGDAIEI